MENQKVFEGLFLSVGAMKTSTTWLYALLACHPQMHVAPEKELHYFHHVHMDCALLDDRRRVENALRDYVRRLDPANVDIARARRTLTWLAKYLEGPVDDRWFANLFPTDPGGYICDFSNLNALLPAKAWKAIAAKTDRLRVIYVLRDPVARAWSHVKFHLRFTGQLAELESWIPKQLGQFIRQPFIRDHGEYGRALRTMRAVLGSDQLKVMFYEDIHANPRAALADLGQFLGIAPFEYPEVSMQRKVNVSPHHPMPDCLPDLMARDVARIVRELRRVGHQAPAAWSA